MSEKTYTPEIAPQLRAGIDLRNPTREDLQRVQAAIGPYADAIFRFNEAKDSMTASERRRGEDEASRAAVEAKCLSDLAAEIEERLPMDPSQRKMRFGQEPKGGQPATGGARSAALRTIDNMRNVPDSGRELLTTSIDFAHERGWDREVDGLSRYVVVASAPAYARAVGKLLRDPINGHREFTGEELAAYQAAVQYQRASMDTTTGSSGGFMLPTHLDPSIILTNAGVVDPMRVLARKALISTLVWNGVTSAGVTASWDAQNAQVSDDTPTLGDVSVPTHKGAAFVAASIETAQDTTIAGELGKLFIDAKMRLEGTAFTTGSGTGEPTGIITTLGGSAQEVAPAVAETFGRADTFAVQEALSARWRPNARFMANLSIINDMRDMPKLPSGTEVSLVDETGPRPRVNGWEVWENSGMDGTINAAATASNYVLLAGDFQQYLVVDRVGTTVEYVPHLFGANGRPTGTRGWYMYWRTGGECLVADAFRLLDVATTA